MEMCYLLFLLSTAAVVLRAETMGLQFNSTYTVTVTETPASDADTDPTPPAPVSGVVLTTTCTHSNATPVADPSDLRYSILEGDPALFSIGEFSGEFSVAEQPFDYEEQPWYLVHLLCYLDSDPSSNGTGVVNVTIGPVNEYLPAISSSSTTVHLHEDHPVGTKIAALASGTALLTYSATDRDDGPDGRITFFLTSAEEQNSSQVFDLDPNTGTLTLKQALDVDDLPGDQLSDTLYSLIIDITACNEDVLASICNNILFTVYVVPADDNDPRFLEPQYSTSLQELSPNGTLVVQVNCKDEDKGVGSVEGITFESGTPNSVSEVFEVNSTGAVLLKRELDYENITSYQFQLVCSDGDTTATTRVTVTVLPVNDNDPRFLQPQYNASVPESTPTQTLITQVICEDEDKGIGSVEGITFENGTPNSVSEVFEVNSTGAVLLKRELDYENTTGYQFQLVCSDGNTTATTQVTVTVLPVNDNSPHFTEDSYEFSVERTAPIGHTVGQVEATDDDVSIGNNITYSIETNSHFGIKTETGEVYLEGSLEEKALMVFASDGEFMNMSKIIITANNSAPSLYLVVSAIVPIAALLHALY